MPIGIQMSTKGSSQERCEKAGRRSHERPREQPTQEAKPERIPDPCIFAALDRERGTGDTVPGSNGSVGARTFGAVARHAGGEQITEMIGSALSPCPRMVDVPGSLAPVNSVGHTRKSLMAKMTSATGPGKNLVQVPLCPASHRV